MSRYRDKQIWVCSKNSKCLYICIFLEDSEKWYKLIINMYLYKSHPALAALILSSLMSSWDNLSGNAVSRPVPSHYTVLSRPNTTGSTKGWGSGGKGNPEAWPGTSCSILYSSPQSLLKITQTHHCVTVINKTNTTIENPPRKKLRWHKTSFSENPRVKIGLVIHFWRELLLYSISWSEAGLKRITN